MKISVWGVLSLLLTSLLCLPVLSQDQLHVDITQPDWNFSSMDCYNTEAGCSYYGVADRNTTLYFFVGADKQLVLVKSDGSPAQEIDITRMYQEIKDDEGASLIPFEDGTIVLSSYRHDEDLRFFQYDLASAVLLPITLSGSPKACHGLPRVSTPSIYRIGSGRQFIACGVQDDQKVIHIVDLDKNTDEVIAIGPDDGTSELDMAVQGGVDGYVYIESELSVSLPDNNRFATLQRYQTDEERWIDIPVLKRWLPGFTDAAEILDTELLGIDETGTIYYRVDWRSDQGQLSLQLLKISPDGQLIGLIGLFRLGDLDFLPLFHTILADGSFVISDLGWEDSMRVISFQETQD